MLAGVMRHYLAIGLIAAALVASVLAVPATRLAGTAFANMSGYTDPSDTTGSLGIFNGTQTSSANATEVDVGKGSNMTVQYYTFTPNVVTINAGDSVTWKSSASMVELHTVTFADSSVTTDIILPFTTSNQTFGLMPPFNAGEPITMPTPNGSAILGLNKLAFYPSVVDANNQTTYLNGTDIQHRMGSEVKVLNSGIIQPPEPPTILSENGTQNTTGTMTSSSLDNNTGSIDTIGILNGTQSSDNATDISSDVEASGPPFPMINSFTVTFDEPGTYSYFCALHPWMTGQVIVNAESSTASFGTDNSNSTTFEEMSKSAQP